MRFSTLSLGCHAPKDTRHQLVEWQPGVMELDYDRMERTLEVRLKTPNA
jgi:hypothetical protein